VGYLKCLGDDSKRYMEVNEAKICGASDEVKELECAGHIQKRMELRMRKLRREIGTCRVQNWEMENVSWGESDLLMPLLISYSNNMN